MVTIKEYFQAAEKQKASDLYLSVGSHPWLRIRGEWHPLKSYPVLGEAEMQALVREVFAPKQLQDFQAHQDLIGAHTIQGLGRLRIILSQGRDGQAMACRLIPLDVPAFEGLGLPATLKRMVSGSSGLVLVIGSAGSGKTTTLASLVNHINNNFHKSILTIEQPIEFVHTNNRSYIEQIQHDDIGMGLDGFRHTGLLETADVMVLDGVQNRESISLGLSAAEKGLLVLAALESNGGVAEALKGILDAYPLAERERKRHLLAQTLRGAVWQHLFPVEGKPYCQPAVEILINDRVISGLISQRGDLHLVRPTMAAGRIKGMQTMHQALEILKQKSLVQEDEILSFENEMLAYYVYPVEMAF
ncbi:MAG: Flp pilus assembly complex ATPase component TadA [Desulfobacteraceae bacterium]|nr:Flp pilus assembly complex ATPase component TadA [Desulfobacteraceae bacterium]